jgi:hypothetical protein
MYNYTEKTESTVCSNDFRMEEADVCGVLVSVGPTDPFSDCVQRLSAVGLDLQDYSRNFSS